LNDNEPVGETRFDTEAQAKLELAYSAVEYFSDSSQKHYCENIVPKSCYNFDFFHIQSKLKQTVN